ncbi:MAG: DUF3987 domain-containing protein [Burkholderiales bacterium]|nr:DUF3987 domain-containing protein [Burkholderiales bacterium]
MSNHYPERGRLAQPDTRLQRMEDATRRSQEKLAEQYLQDVKLGFDFPSKKMPNFLTLLIAESLGNENPAYIYATVCTAVAMVTQGKVRINMPSGQTYNLNSFFYIIGPAASGKSVVIEKYLSPIHEIDGFRCLRRAENLSQIKAEHSVLMLDKKKLSKEYQRLPDGEHKNELAEQLRKIEMQLSVKLPTHGSIIVNETTRAGIISRLEKNAGSLALVSDEANKLSTYTIGSDPGLFNHLYDGRKYSKSTLDYADITFNKIHFCMLTAIQNSRAAKVFTRYGEDWIESGFTSRLLPVICTEADLITQYQSTECGSNYFTEYKDKIKQIDALFQERELLAIYMNGPAIELMTSLINNLRQEWAGCTKMISMLVRAEMHTAKLAAIFMFLRNLINKFLGFFIRK